MQSIRNNLIIELHVPDLELAETFYAKLGFVKTMHDQVNEKELGYITMTRDDELGRTMLNFYGGDERVYEQSYFKQFPPDTKRGYASEVTIPTKNIAAYYEKIKAAVPDSIVRELVEKRDHDFVWRDFRMEDPFGFYLRFTELLDWGQSFDLNK